MTITGKKGLFFNATSFVLPGSVPTVSQNLSGEYLPASGHNSAQYVTLHGLYQEYYCHPSQNSLSCIHTKPNLFPILKQCYAIHWTSSTLLSALLIQLNFLLLFQGTLQVLLCIPVWAAACHVEGRGRCVFQEQYPGPLQLMPCVETHLLQKFWKWSEIIAGINKI